jgi:hypothetical protein
VNGIARLTDDGGLEIAVVQAFPNCPKYNPAPRARGQCDGAGHAAVRRRAPGSRPTLPRGSLAADTFFVASRGADGVLDVSHPRRRPGLRGAARGRLAARSRLPGNSMFNTFGNLLRDPRSSLLCP